MSKTTNQHLDKTPSNKSDGMGNNYLSSVNNYEKSKLDNQYRKNFFYYISKCGSNMCSESYPLRIPFPDTTLLIVDLSLNRLNTVTTEHKNVRVDMRESRYPR